MSTPLIEFRNVTVYQGSRPALNGLSLAIGQGEHVAILGPNGSGKSTLIKTITRELYPRAGTPDCVIQILGASNWDIFDLRPLLGIVTQDLVESCRNACTALEIVLSGFFSSLRLWPWDIPTPAMRHKAMEILEFLDMAHLVHRPTVEMSSGELRRVVIARTLVHDPKALLLDEPTNSLDFRAFTDLRDTMRKLARQGVGVVLVTHHLPDIIPEIQRVICLKEGRLFRDGTKEAVLRADTLQELFGVEVQVLRQGDYYLLH
jgi:iron complex transport system ATP-binding protein